MPSLVLGLQGQETQKQWCEGNDFLVVGLLSHSGYSEAPAPSGLLLKMFPFQKQTLSWMMDQENLPGGSAPTQLSTLVLPAVRARVGYEMNQASVL